MEVLALFVLLSFRSSVGVAGSAAEDLESLLKFKRLSDPGNVLSDWNQAGKNHCYWFGVTCDLASGRVTGLNITGGRRVRPPSSGSVGEVVSFDGKGSLLAGTLAPAVANLTELRFLVMPYNAFSGEIPAEIGQLSYLEVLELQGNNFSGHIPDQISGLSSLVVLNLAYNSLSGEIPENLIGLSGIRTINLSYNQLSGGIKVKGPSGCKFLAHLRLSSNFLVGEIPPDISKCSNLQALLLDGNILVGPIPAEIGRLSNLQLLDVSKNSLTDRIPKELANCRKLSVLVLTNLADFEDEDSGLNNVYRGEFNAFVGGIPWEILSIPNLEIVWAPRANLNGRLPDDWNSSCKLRVLNLAQNYRIVGGIPQTLGMCRNLSFLDLSSNDLRGSVPSPLRANCMVYLNVSRNSLSGFLPEFKGASCDHSVDVFTKEVFQTGYSSVLSNTWLNNPFSSVSNELFAVLHDFSWNNFQGPIPLFSFGEKMTSEDRKLFYGLLLNNNEFNGSFPSQFFLNCTMIESFAVNLSVNQISGTVSSGSLCSKLIGWEAASNQLVGSFPPGIEDLKVLSFLDLRDNRINGTIPHWLAELMTLKNVLIGNNMFTGDIPPQLGQLPHLTVLDLSRNDLTGKIPGSLASASSLEIVLLDHNKLTGEIPSSFSRLANLTVLDVAFNNLSGNIPHLENLNSCKYFQGNVFLQPCPNLLAASPTGLPVPLQVRKSLTNDDTKLKPFAIALVASASLVVLMLILLTLLLISRRRKLVRQGSIRRKIIVTFTDTPPELNYENVIRSTGNFSIQNLIGTGGFGATYKAELLPEFFVAVKRLSIGKFQGLQQFDAEIRTLGRIRHKNLVTLIGYHMGGSETFLIYNYLSGGNLETFIHDRSGTNVRWPIIHRIALDIAHALAYLHESCVPRIVHRDIKPSNILLDEEFNAYLSDFGLARLLEVSETHATTDVAGTFGYVAPEYATTCRVSDKSDVYSFGVVLLELMSGKRSLDPSFSDYGNGFNIVAWEKLLVNEGRISEVFSPELWEAGPRDNLVGLSRLASACTVDSLSVRPSMKQVVERLKKLK